MARVSSATVRILDVCWKKSAVSDMFGTADYADITDVMDLDTYSETADYADYADIIDLNKAS